MQAAASHREKIVQVVLFQHFLMKQTCPIFLNYHNKKKTRLFPCIYLCCLTCF